MNLGALAKSTFRQAVTISPLPEILTRRGANRHLTVVAFHRIGEVDEATYPFKMGLFSATAAEFEREIVYLKRNFDILTTAELAICLRDENLPDRPAVITFDDGYRDNYQVAYPLLAKHAVPACFFVTTGWIGTSSIPWWDQVACCFKQSKFSSFTSPFGGRDFFGPGAGLSVQALNAEAQRFVRSMKAVRWPDALCYLEDLKTETKVDPELAIDQPIVISWDEAREMQTGGMEIGGHTRTHPILGMVEVEQIVKDEIHGCRVDLERELGNAAAAFSYPEGSPGAMSETADKAIVDAGFTVSFSYADRLAPRHALSPWRIPRFHSEFGDNFGHFRFSLARALSQHRWRRVNS